MPNSSETKQAIKAEINRLENSKSILKKQLDQINEKRDRYRSRIDEIDSFITKLKVDLNG